MSLDPEDLDGIARLLARRFPEGDERVALARAAGLDEGPAANPDAAQAWAAVTKEAARRHRLGRLAALAAERRYADENLRALALTLGTLQPARRRIWLLLPVLALAGVGWGLGGRDARTPPSAGVPETQVAAPVAEVPVAEVPVAEVPVAELPSPGVPSPAPLPAPPVATAPAAGSEAGRCGGAPGERIGYWYAGEQFTARQGEVYTIRAGANVRAEYPRLENGWNARSRARCALLPGDQVRLSEAPFLVEGGSWWVPMQAGDLLTP